MLHAIVKHLMPWIKLFSFLISLSLIVPAYGGAKPTLGLNDDELLDTLQKSMFNYFLNERNKTTGMVFDRAHNFKRGATKYPSSITATGFALTVYPVGVERD